MQSSSSSNAIGYTKSRSSFILPPMGSSSPVLHISEDEVERMMQSRDRSISEKRNAIADISVPSSVSTDYDAVFAMDEESPKAISQSDVFEFENNNASDDLKSCVSSEFDASNSVSMLGFTLDQTALPVMSSYLYDADLKQAETLLAKVQEGFGDSATGPQLSGDGSGGTYMMMDSSKSKVAVFKPADEEAFAPNNPRGHVGELGTPSFRQGIRSGEAACREVAAYLLDWKHFSGVPFTGLVDICHPAFQYPEATFRRHAKRGSLQEFVDFDEIAGDMSCKMFSVHEVHKIAVLDIRIVNTDRNDGNILVKRDPKSRKLTLIPIDHGYCLPDILEIAWCDWIWMEWPQAKEPFDDETKEYILNLNPDQDYQNLMSALKIRLECLVYMKIMTKFLQKGVAAGLNLYQIAKMIARDKLEAPSHLEIIVSQARALARNHLEKVTRREPASMVYTRSASFHMTNGRRSVVHSQPSGLSKIESQPQKPLELTRRTSFTSINSLEESAYPKEFNSEFWKFLEGLMDSLVERKASEIEEQKSSGMNEQGHSVSSRSQLLDSKQGSALSKSVLF